MYQWIGILTAYHINKDNTNT